MLLGDHTNGFHPVDEVQTRLLGYNLNRDTIEPPFLTRPDTPDHNGRGAVCVPMLQTL